MPYFPSNASIFTDIKMGWFSKIYRYFPSSCIILTDAILTLTLFFFLPGYSRFGSSNQTSSLVGY